MRSVRMATVPDMCWSQQVVGGRTIAVDWAVPKAQFQQNAPAEAPAAEEDPTHAENAISDDDDADSAEEEAARASEQQDEVASEVQLEDEKKLLRSVLSQIDDGDDDETPQAKVKVFLQPSANSTYGSHHSCTVFAAIENTLA